MQKAVYDMNGVIISLNRFKSVYRATESEAR